MLAGLAREAGRVIEGATFSHTDTSSLQGSREVTTCLEPANGAPQVRRCERAVKHDGELADRLLILVADCP